MNVEDINIRENTCTGGYCCVFHICNKKFRADVYNVFGNGPECMVFEYDENDEIDLSGVYYNKDVDVSKESLLRCVKEFAEKEYEI